MNDVSLALFERSSLTCVATSGRFRSYRPRAWHHLHRCRGCEYLDFFAGAGALNCGHNDSAAALD